MNGRVTSDKDICPRCHSNSVAVLGASQRIYDPLGQLYQCQQPGCGGSSSGSRARHRPPP